MKEGGMALNMPTVQYMFKQIKCLKKTGVSFEDLMEAMTLKDNEIETKEDYEKLFAIYDRKRRGWFTLADYLGLWKNTKQKFEE